MNPKIVFAGTPEWAAQQLEALVHAGFQIVAVLTRADQPYGRGRKTLPNPVKKVAVFHQIPIYQPTTLKNFDEIKLFFDTYKPDVVVDIAYGAIVPSRVLSIPRYGFINVHPSLLPRFRGPAPIQHSLLAGDRETGISIMQLSEGIDTGPIYLQKSIPIHHTDTTETLSNRLAPMASELLIHALHHLDNLTPKKQSEAGACYAVKIKKEMAEIDWKKSATILDREIRAYNPWPISYSTLGGEIVRIYQAFPSEELHTAEPGEIIRMSHHGLTVATGKGLLQIQSMQFPGGKVLPISDLLNGKRSFFNIHQRFQHG